MSGRRLFSAGSVLILSSRAVDEGFCDGKRKKKKALGGRRFCEAQRSVQWTGGCCKHVFFVSFMNERGDWDLLRGSRSIVALFSPVSSFPSFSFLSS